MKIQECMKSLTFGLFCFFVCLFLFSKPTFDESKKLEKNCDVVVFSYDRPMQLWAFLESAKKLHSVGEIIVIYRSSNQNFQNAYQKVVSNFPKINLKKQINAPGDFKKLTMDATFNSPSKFICFAVDDIVVKKEVDFNDCIEALNATGAFGFFLRLGKNINYCFMLKKPTPSPSLEESLPGVFEWHSDKGSGDWAYPNNVDMTVYRKRDIFQFFNKINFNNPTELESNWHNGFKNSKKCLCFEESKILNLTVNVSPGTPNAWQFSKEWNKKCSEYSTQALLEKFNSGFRLDIEALKKINNNSPHVNLEPKLK